MLICGNRLASQHSIHGCAQILPRHWNARAGTASIELSAIDQTHFGIEEEEIGRACGLIRLGHILCFVVKIVEGKAAVFCLLTRYSGLSSGLILTSLLLMATIPAPVS